MAQKGSIVPLIILLIVVGVLAAIGFVAYSIAHDVGHKTKAKLEKKNVSFSREGMKVGVKGRTQEQQEDAAQRYYTAPSVPGKCSASGLADYFSSHPQCNNQDLEQLVVARV